MTYIAPDPPSAYAIPPFAGQPDLGCRDADPELFFAGAETADEAKRFCRHCDYRRECLEFALATEQRFGVWGGATPKERNRLRPDPRCGTDSGYQTHLRAGGEACEPCLLAHAVRQSARGAR